MKLRRRPTRPRQLFTRPVYRRPAVPAPTRRLPGLHPDELRRGDHVIAPEHPRGGFVVSMLISGAADGTVVAVSARHADLSVVLGPDDRLTVHRPTR